jgi:hypothetical protein
MGSNDHLNGASTSGIQPDTDQVLSVKIINQCAPLTVKIDEGNFTLSRRVEEADVPPSIQWLEKFLPAIIQFSIFGGSITFAVILSQNEPPDRYWTKNEVQSFLCTSWLFFMLTLLFASAPDMVLSFRRKDIIQRKSHPWIQFCFTKAPISLVLQILILLALFYVSLVIVAYSKLNGWVAVAFSTGFLLVAIVTWIVQSFGGVIAACVCHGRSNPQPDAS